MNEEIKFMVHVTDALKKAFDRCERKIREGDEKETASLEKENADQLLNSFKKT